MKVSIKKQAEGSGFWYRLEVRDHAIDSSEVCNATSALVYGLIGYLYGRKDITAGQKVSEDPSYPWATVWCHTDDMDEGVDAVWLMVTMTLLQMEKSYPRSMRVTGYMDMIPEGEKLEIVYLNELPADNAVQV